MAADPVRVLVDRLARAFARHADKDRAVGARAYMRNQFDFYGIPSPLLTQIAREVTTDLPPPTQAQLARLARTCWKRPEREWQYIACGYLRRNVEGCDERSIATAKALILAKSWWDTVDTLAIHTVGPLVRNHPVLLRTMDEWIGSENIWLARTAILHQMTYKSDTDVERLFGYCASRSADREFFIRKAIGWALREYSKTDAAAVRRFVREHRSELSPLSRTEALKWLERRKKASA